MEFIKLLPSDIISYIIPFTYRVQPKVLLNDIISYYTTKKQILSFYYGIWIGKYDEKDDVKWLMNDLNLYVNDYKALINGFVDNFYGLFQRYIMLTNNSDVNKYIFRLNKEKVENQINIFWGLLLPEERIEFIQNTTKQINFFYIQ